MRIEPWQSNRSFDTLFDGHRSFLTTVVKGH